MVSRSFDDKDDKAGPGNEDAHFALSSPHSREHISIYTVKEEPLFFQHFDEAFFPTLWLFHKCMS
jgi:predicted ribosome-associated RNA-binding protein Tma20